MSNEHHNPFVDGCISGAQDIAQVGGTGLAVFDASKEVVGFAAGMAPQVAGAAVVATAFPPSILATFPIMSDQAYQEGKEIGGNFIENLHEYPANIADKLEFSCYVADEARQDLQNTWQAVEEKIELMPFVVEEVGDRLHDFVEDVGNSVSNFSEQYIPPVWDSMSISAPTPTPDESAQSTSETGLFGGYGSSQDSKDNTASIWGGDTGSNSSSGWGGSSDSSSSNSNSENSGSSSSDSGSSSNP